MKRIYIALSLVWRHYALHLLKQDLFRVKRIHSLQKLNVPTD